MMRRLTTLELVTRHKPAITSQGSAITATFADLPAAQAFFHQLVVAYAQREALDDEAGPEAELSIPQNAVRLIRIIDLKEGPEPGRAILELEDRDRCTHRLFVDPADLYALASIRLVAQRQGGYRAKISPTDDKAVAADPPEAAPQQGAEVDRQDDLRELALLRTRLGRAEQAIRHQRQRLNSLRSAFAKRFGYATGRYPSYCCQRCGEQIGWIGRAFQAIGVPLHACRAEREEA